MAKRRLAVAGLVALAGVLSAGGCVATPVVMASAGLSVFQAGTTAYVRGELEYADAVPLEVMHEAVLRAVDAMQFRLVRQNLRNRHSNVVAAEFEGREIKIDLERKSPIVTKINIRIGVFGDQAVSRLMQQAIQQEVPKEFEMPQVIEVEIKEPKPAPGYAE